MIEVGLFKFIGVGCNKRFGFLVDFCMGKIFEIVLNGKVSLLGLSVNIDVSIKFNGFWFKVGGKVFDIF